MEHFSPVEFLEEVLLIREWTKQFNDYWDLWYHL